MKVVENVLAIYAPIGIIIFILRICIGLHVFLIASILPRFSILRRVVLRVMYIILGIVITSEGSENRDDDVGVLVANHVSVCDHLAVNLVLPCTVPKVHNLPKFLSWAMGYEEMGASQGRQSLVNNVKNYCSQQNRPVLAFPEGAMTNGTVGLLKFSSWPFSVQQSVQPVCISASRPLLPASLCNISSSLWMDMMWFLFVPCTLFHVRVGQFSFLLDNQKLIQTPKLGAKLTLRRAFYSIKTIARVLPAMTKQELQSVEEFAQEVQQKMAEELKVEATKFTSQEKTDYLKRKAKDSTQASSNSSPADSIPSTPPTPPPSPTQKEPPKFDFRKSWSEKTLNEELEIMVKQVKGVLLDTDVEIIRKDLEKTNSVDATITNIVEGRIPQEVPLSDTAATESDATLSPSEQYYDEIELVPTNPSDACRPIENILDVKGQIALVRRGGCSFLSKALTVADANAAAIFIYDHDLSNDWAFVDMVGDGTNRDTELPAAFMLGRDGQRITESLTANGLKSAILTMPYNVTGIPLGHIDKAPWTLW
ncbi:Ancient ubiquitous protein 1 [Holothuria leucospilota]|uniref:Ancient ubiquitous protein 1 n=1 Tax=Holothuria leucospilota TaxID=206669 RepID=A0A9Q0YNC4_HOLLE|nr:Ancient ubiquitous protein 1 [Holothuria leucospilota]